METTTHRSNVGRTVIDVASFAALIMALACVYWFVPASSVPNVTLNSDRPAHLFEHGAGAVVAHIEPAPPALPAPPVAEQAAPQAEPASASPIPQVAAREVNDQVSVRATSRIDDTLKKESTPLPPLNVTRAPPKPEHVVEFFSVKAKAGTVAFVVDCSGSMHGAPSTRAFGEVAQAILKLKRDQEFYVIFFNEEPVHLFRDKQPALMTATPRQKVRVFRQLQRMGVGGGTNPEPSLEIAARLNPDVIFLLSDGIFDPLSFKLMQKLQHQGIHVNTIAFESAEIFGNQLFGGGGSHDAAEGLKLISDATQGTYRYVAPSTAPPLGPAEMGMLLMEELVESLPAAKDDEVEDIHQGLRELTNQDFGPAPGAGAAAVAAAVQEWRRWGRQKLAPIYAGLDEPALLEHIRNGSPMARWAALSAAGKRKLDIPLDLLAALHATDDDIIQVARQALKALAGKADFGPRAKADAAEQARAIQRWQRWLDCRGFVKEITPWKNEALLALLGDADAARRWAAVTVITQRRLKAPDELLALLGDADEDVREEVKNVLVEMVSANDVGPPLSAGKQRYIPDGLIKLLAGDDGPAKASSDAALRAIAQRTGWSAELLPATASESEWGVWWIAEKEQRAQKQLVLGKQLFDRGSFKPALKRFREIQEQFPDTPTAAEASRLAAQVALQAK